MTTIANRLGYHPHAPARALRLATTQTIGLLLPDLGNPIYAQVVRGAQLAATAKGYVLIIGSAHDGETTEKAFADLLNQSRVDGLIIASASLADSTVSQLAATNAPIVLANRRASTALTSAVVDDEAAAWLATDHLLSLGHRHLAHVSGSRLAETTLRRDAGFAAAAAGRALSTFTVRAGTLPAQGYAAAVKIFSQRPHVTAIVVSSFRAAVGVLHAAWDCQRNVPKTLSVIAIHDDIVADHLTPPLTTVLLPMTELGIRSVEMLVGILHGQPPSHYMIPTRPRIRIRNSTACLEPYLPNVDEPHRAMTPSTYSSKAPRSTALAGSKELDSAPPAPTGPLRFPSR